MVGRGALLQKKKENEEDLLARRARGIWVLTGQPGVGQTRLLWAVGRHGPRDTPHFFYRYFFSGRSRHTRLQGDWSSDVCSSDLRSQGSRRHSPLGFAASGMIAPGSL